MERIYTRSSEAIAYPLEWFPRRLRDLAGADVFCGDPIFAGLHSTAVALDGRSYSDTAHACYPYHTRDKRVTIVFPDPPAWTTVVHEFGHALDWRLQELTDGQSPSFAAVSEYARTNREEAFAEAFTARFYPPDASPYGYDRESREFFDRLIDGGW